jgi:hypothetical protein
VLCFAILHQDALVLRGMALCVRSSRLLANTFSVLSKLQRRLDQGYELSINDIHFGFSFP